MTLSCWIKKEGGPTRVAKKLNVSRQIVWLWKSGKNTPQLKNVKKIISLSKGKLTANAILKGRRVN